MTTTERLEAARARYERDKHGKDAFMGSSAWGAYQAARRELREAEAAFDPEPRGGDESGPGFASPSR